MFSNNTFNNPVNRTNITKSTIWIIAICLLCSLVIGITIAFFYEDDWATSGVGMSGPVNIEAVGVGDVSIEDADTCNLVVSLDDNYEVLIPGMPIDLTANCKVYQSNTKPLLRAMLTLDLMDMEMEEIFDENSTLETSRLMITQNILNQLNNQIEENGWYLHTDSYYYYIGEDVSEVAGGGVH